tara:strand:+ start:82 stop:1005 length:924 start_codon:yes stop_codon:yes gene_type:complete
MNIKLWSHIMPWDIDYALLMAIQLKKSKYYLPQDVNITIDLELNLTSYLYNWEESKIPKDYFIDKFNTLLLLLGDYKVNTFIYDGDELYGHLNQQKNIISLETDYYIGVCPDTYFSEYALTYLIESAKQITNKYFVITPQVHKVGDDDWDRIVDPKYLDVPYSDYLKVDIFDIRYNNKINNQERYLEPLYKSKFAGWFDLYSKSFYEELCPVQKEWNGYGPWDYYSMVITDYCKSKGVDVQQYVLRGETIWMYPSGPLLENGANGFTQYYRDRLKTNIVPNQREEFESKIEEYVNKTLTDLKNKNII